MDLIRNSGLNPVANSLLVELQDVGDLFDGQEPPSREAQPRLVRFMQTVEEQSRSGLVVITNGGQTLSKNCWMRRTHSSPHGD